MFTTAILAILAASSVIAAPVTQEARGKSTPAHYAEGYLESYDSYHSRYISIGCAGNQGTSFFDNCCRPLLASETVEANRPDYCAAGFKAQSGSTSSSSSSAKAVESPKAAPSAAAAAPKAAESSAPAAAAVAVAQPSAAAPAPAPAPAPSAAAPQAPSGGATHTGGFATYFHQNGNPGACGNYNSDSGYGVAIDGNGFWQNYGSKSEHCGKYVNIKNAKTGATVRAQIWDVCPTCVNDNSLDLSVAAFQAIADLSQGMVPIEWSWA